METPKSWSQVTARQWARMLAASSLEPKERENAVVEAALDLEPGGSEDLSPAEYRQAVSDLEFTNRPPRRRLRRTVEVDGRTLHLFDSFEEVTMGELYDLEECVADWNAAVGRALSLLYRERSDDGRRLPYDPVACSRLADSLLDALTAEDAHGASLFFSLVAGSSSIASLGSSSPRNP